MSPDPARVGDVITFTNLSMEANRFEWFVQGVPVSTSESFQRRFLEGGTFLVALRASGPGGTSFALRELRVNDPRQNVSGAYVGALRIVQSGGSTINAPNVTYLLSPSPISFDQIVIDMSGYFDIPPREATTSGDHSFNIDYSAGGFRYVGSGTVSGSSLQLNYTYSRVVGTTSTLIATYSFTGRR
jgi:hypothetical protein